MLKSVHRSQIKEIIESTEGKIFSLGFVKKDGSYREMICRTKPMSREVPPHLVTVFDMQAPSKDGSRGAYRNVNMNTVNQLTVKGKTYAVHG